MKINSLFSFLIILAFSFSIRSIPNDLFFKVNKDGPRTFLNQLIEKKYKAKIGDNFEADISLILKSSNYKEILRSIFNLGIDVNIEVSQEDQKFCRLLHIAMSRNDEDLALFLIENGADVNAADCGGIPPLGNAIITKFKKGINLLLKHGAFINAKFDCGITAIELASTTDDLEIIEFLIQHGAKFDQTCADGTYQILFNAIAADNENLVRLLLKHGLNITHQVGALNYAIYFQRNKSMVNLLINSRVDINAKDKDGNTPLFTAILRLKPNDSSTELEKQNKEKIQEIIELLLLKGANPNIICDYEYSVLDLAKLWDTKTYDLLLQYGAEPADLLTNPQCLDKYLEMLTEKFSRLKK